MKPRIVEVSHAIDAGMTTYPGLPAPRAETLLDYEASRARYAGGAEFFIASLHLCGNTGTYVDSPRHRFRDGADLAELPIERLAHLPVTLVDVRARVESGALAVGADVFRDVQLEGRAVLVRTGFAKHWRTERYLAQNPFLTARACELLVEAKAAFVGIDSLNVDDVDDLARPAHTKLLGAGVPVCEHMKLAGLDEVGGHLHAAPIAWVGGATFPVRAYVVYG